MKVRSLSKQLESGIDLHFLVQERHTPFSNNLIQSSFLSEL